MYDRSHNLPNRRNISQWIFGCRWESRDLQLERKSHLSTLALPTILRPRLNSHLENRPIVLPDELTPAERSKRQAGGLMFDFLMGDGMHPLSFANYEPILPLPFLSQKLRTVRTVRVIRRTGLTPYDIYFLIPFALLWRAFRAFEAVQGGQAYRPGWKEDH
ncbi:hypothetical protein BDM02DRAFT_3107218 [Thelephora ganbajun]|uniref:Uncharacterized protein n=1 Tax=Thelephora ganbajun TaxID=370292 RepID=A0ACB6ZX55_THEGA|nr:hypothetical protein BDM02DRAFT_3107218 [Thelephora ganbajun]